MGGCLLNRFLLPLLIALIAGVLVVIFQFWLENRSELSRIVLPTQPPLGVATTQATDATPVDEPVPLTATARATVTNQPSTNSPQFSTPSAGSFLESVLSTILSVVTAWLLPALVIYIVGRLNLGLTVLSFVDALVAAAVIAIVTWLITWLLGLLGIAIGGGWAGVTVALLVSTVILLVSDRFISGMMVRGFFGPLIAAIAIAVVTWLVGILGL